VGARPCPGVACAQRLPPRSAPAPELAVLELENIRTLRQRSPPCWPPSP
jgi:hypothetical protein